MPEYLATRKKNVYFVYKAIPLLFINVAKKIYYIRLLSIYYIYTFSKFNFYFIKLVIIKL